jgi:putative ABC transport system permease protein
VGSFRVTFVEWLDTTLGADLYLSSPYSTLSRGDGFGPDVAARVAAVPGVERVASESHFTLDTPRYGPIHVVGVTEDISSHRRFVWRDPSLSEQSLAQGAVLISQPLAFRHHLRGRTGLTVELPTDRGTAAYRVAGIYYDYGSERGSVLMDATTYRRAFPRRPVTAVAAFVRSGQGVDEVCQRVRRALGASYNLQVLTNRALRANALDVFERTFAITSALRVLVGVVAFLGVLSSLLALQLERQLEIATLRSLGMTVVQMCRMVVVETLLLSGTAGLLALPCGTALARVLVEVINPRSFGWTLAFVPHLVYYVEAFGLALVAGLLAGAYPAYAYMRAGTPRSLQVD